MSAPTGLYPSTEQVAVAWAKAVGADDANIDPTKVATSLPADPSVWSTTGFVTVTAVGGGSDVHVPLYESAVTFDCWANTPNSSRAPWGQAAALASALLRACYRHDPMTVDPGEAFHSARLLSVYPAQMPRRIPSDASNFARVALDLVIAWTVTP
jgi:hypothetical protein